MNQEWTSQTVNSQTLHSNNIEHVRWETGSNITESVVVWEVNYGKSHYHIFQQVWKQDKRCDDDRGPVSRIHLHGTAPGLNVNNSCCLLLAANCLESHCTYCVCPCALIGLICLNHAPVGSGRICGDLQLRDSVKQKKEIQTDTHLSGPSPLPEFVVFMCPTHVWTRVDFLQDWAYSETDFAGETTSTPEPRSGRSSFVCRVYQSVTGRVYVYGSSRPSWPHCPDLPPPAWQRRTESVSVLFPHRWLHFYQSSTIKLWLQGFSRRCVVITSC